MTENKRQSDQPAAEAGKAETNQQSTAIDRHACFNDMTRTRL